MAYSFAAHLARYGPAAIYPPLDLAKARGYCAGLTRAHYENFSVASIMLPRRLLPHFFAVYAYCRWADDLGDETGGGQDSLDLLTWWRGELLRVYAGKAHHPVMVALQPTIERFHIPPQPFLDLLSAFEQDQRVKRYATFDELLGYCRHSANPVGRLVLHLFECANDETIELSDSICTGLQLANFWQDIERDGRELGRIYLPEEDLRRFGYSEEELRARRFTPAFRDLMKFEVERARRFLEAGRPLLDLVPREVCAQIELFLEGGLAILKKIEAAGYDVLTARPQLRPREKVTLLMAAMAGNTSIGYRVSGIGKANHSRRRVADTRYPIPDARSFAWCHRLARKAAKNFYYAFLVLPRGQRRAMEALYAFMRVTDDLADEPGEISAKRATLSDWRAALDRCLQGEYSHPLHPALHRIVARHGIPAIHLHEVIDGVEMDLNSAPFKTFADLQAYCYRVASAVGLCCIQIWGFTDERAKEHAIAAGIALQLTNILRDLGEDLERGRVYVPQEDLDRFQCDLRRDAASDSFQNLMRFQIERARSFYRQAQALDGYLEPAGRAVFQIMRRTYEDLLNEIERRHYDVFSDRVRLPRWRKLQHLLSAFPIRWGWR